MSLQGFFLYCIVILSVVFAGKQLLGGFVSRMQIHVYAVNFIMKKEYLSIRTVSYKIEVYYVAVSLTFGYLVHRPFCKKKRGK